MADGFDLSAYHALKGALTAAGASPVTIGIRKSRVSPQSGNAIIPDHFLEGARSTLFDAIIIPSGPHVKTLSSNGRAIHWVREAFGHCKPLGAIGEG